MKRIFIVLIVLLVIAGGIFFYLRQNKLKDFEPLIKQKLSQLVFDASHGLYHLEIGTLRADVVGSKIILVNAHLRPDTLVYAQMVKSQQAPNDLFDISVREISIDNIVPADFIANRAINLRRLFINKPVITVSHQKQAYNVPDEDSSKTVYQLIQKDVSGIQLDTLILQNIDFIYKNKSKKGKETRLENVKVIFSDILVDSTTQFDRQRFLFAKNCLINLKGYTVNTSDNLYRFSVGDVEIQTNRQAMQLKKLHFAPRVSIADFYKQVKHQQDRFELTIDHMNFSKVEWWSILGEESFLVKKVSMQNGSLKVYNDKSQPIDTRSKVGKYPQQLLMELPFPLKLDTFNISNLDISYTELNPKSGEKGTLYFNNAAGVITNITNDPDEMKRNAFIKVSANAQFMKQAPIKAAFLFDLSKYKNGNFTVTAAMGPLKGEVLNEITIPLGLQKVNSINIKSLDVSMKGDNYQANGTVKLIYNDLNITALKESGDTLKKRGLLSFIANTFIIKKDNPANGQPVRVEHAVYERNRQRSFFNLVWKTIFTGAGKTVGYNKKK